MTTLPSLSFRQFIKGVGEHTGLLCCANWQTNSKGGKRPSSLSLLNGPGYLRHGLTGVLGIYLVYQRE